jgi:hypothetical protein
MGPFAEDFWNAFRLGDDPRGIGHLDIDGVNFAGIKALEERTRQLQARQAEVDRLRGQVESLDARVRELEALVRRLAPPQP